MGMKKKIHTAFLQGVDNGLKSDQLLAFIRTNAPKASDRRIAKVGLDALHDPDITDRQTLNAIYSVAIRRRLASEKSREHDKSTAKADRADATEADKSAR